MKFNCFKAGLCLLIGLICFFACEQEQLDLPTLAPSNISSSSGPTAALRTSPSVVKWVKKKALRLEEIRQQLGLTTSIALLEIAAHCSDRTALAQSLALDLKELTEVVELADLQRTGMSNLAAALLHSAFAMELQHPSNPSPLLATYRAQIKGTSQIINASTLASFPENTIHTLLKQFKTQYCPDCFELPIPSNQQVSHWINRAQTLPPIVTYTCGCEKQCLFNNIILSPPPHILINPGKAKWVKKKAQRFEQIKSQLKVSNAHELLQLTSHAQQRQQLALTHQLHYLELTSLTELADLQRTGLSIYDAILLQFTIESFANSINFPHTFFEYEGQLLNTLLLSELASKHLSHWIIQFVEQYCMDCSKLQLPTPPQLHLWITKAKSLPPVIHYH
ncbi:MAG: hypothetical protein AAGD05_09780 [Bacteroidota bacterium]